MLNSSSMQNLFISNQNFDPNIFPISSNITNYGLTNIENINPIYQKNIIQKKNSATLLTTQNNQFNNVISPSPVSFYNMNNSIYNPSVNSIGVVNNNIYSINQNQNVQQKVQKGMQRYYSSENLHPLNLPSIGVVTEDNKNNNMHIVETKVERIIHSKTNFMPVNKVNKSKIAKIPHPQFKKKVILQNKINNNNNSNIFKYNDIYNTYNNNNYSFNNNNLNDYNTSNLVVDNSINNLTNNDINLSVNNNINNSINNNIVSCNNNFNSFYVEEEPGSDFKLTDFIALNEIGHGAEGIITAVKWKKNNKIYALKKCEIIFDEAAKKKKLENNEIKDVIDSTGGEGIIKIYGNLIKTNEFGTYYFYELMEYAEKDWEKEILERQKNNLFYEEYELMDIFSLLIKTFSALQLRHITHRDVKPQNIMMVNGKPKICDFGNARIIKREGIIIQKIRGSELFMSPIVFKGYHSGIQTIKHNTYKSDVFSLGMCFFFAAALNYGGLNIIREIYNVNIIKKVLNNFLGKKYSQNLINLIFIMLQIDENKRPDFTELELLLP